MPDDVVIGTSRIRTEGLLQFDPFWDDWPLLGKVDVLINCIGMVQETVEDTFEKIHISLAEMIIYHYTLIGSPRIIQLSALGADVHAASAFLSTKGYADELLMELEHTLVIRPSIVCTPGTMLIQKLKLVQQILRYSFGLAILSDKIAATRIQPVMVDDLLNLFCKAVEQPLVTAIVEIGGADVYTVEKLIHIAAPSARILKVRDIIFQFIFRIAALLKPDLLNKELLLLLSEDNTTASDSAQQILGRPLSSTRAFFKEQLK